MLFLYFYIIINITNIQERDATCVSCSCRFCAMRNFQSDHEFYILCSEKDGLKCEYMLQRGFSEGVAHSRIYHSHSVFEIFFVVSGRVRLFIQEHDVTLLPGDILIIPPNCVHFVFADTSSLKRSFRFLFSAAEENCAAGSLFSEFSSFFSSIKDYYIVNAPDIYHSYIEPAIRNFHNDLPDDTVEPLLLLALTHIARQNHVNKTDGTKNWSDSHSIIIIEEFLNSNYHAPLKLCDIAALLHLSCRQTERVIKKLFHTTFCGLVTQKRLTIAKYMLKETDIPISKISEMVGFSNQSYFFRKFRASEHDTPNNYRRTKKAVR